jgi:hypothetical protein
MFIIRLLTLPFDIIHKEMKLLRPRYRIRLLCIISQTALVVSVLMFTGGLSHLPWHYALPLIPPPPPAQPDLEANEEEGEQQKFDAASETAGRKREL